MHRVYLEKTKYGFVQKTKSNMVVEMLWACFAVTERA